MTLGFIDRALASAANHTGDFVMAHPRSLSAAVTLALAGFAATAFGIAPSVPDASDLPKRMVTESVTPQSIESQIDALAAYGLQLYRSDSTRAGDTADALLRRLNIDDPAAASFLRTDPLARRLFEGRYGKMVQARTESSGVLGELVARYAAGDAQQSGSQFTRLRISRQGSKFESGIETGMLVARLRMGSGTVRTSLFAATDEARIPDGVASQLAEVFATDIDFHRELRRGDTFSVLYEVMTADGEPITWSSASVGRVVAAEFVNGGRRYSALWFEGAAGKGSYYGFDGQSRRRSFLASPLEFSRVTSGFAMRMHPLQNRLQQHQGVDYAAPSGTAVRSVADGVVDFAGWQNGYGNVVQLKHGNDRSTIYAHLSRIDVTQGQRVDQGARLGAVGATGWATGPHLHFEFKVGGHNEDPMAIAKSSESVVIGPSAKADFTLLARTAKGQLELAQTLGRAGTAAE